MNSLKDYDSNSAVQIIEYDDYVLIKARDSGNPNVLLDELHQLFEKLIKQGTVHIAFDLAQIPLPNGSFIAFLISKTYELRRLGGDLGIVNMMESAGQNLSFFTPLTYLTIPADNRPFSAASAAAAAQREDRSHDDYKPNRLRVNATVDALQDVTDFVLVWAESAGVEPVERNKLKIAVHEACMNVIEHGYQFEAGNEIEIEVESDEHSFRVMISDWGQPFEAFGHSDYNVHEAFENQKRGGYGFYIMQQSVDEIRYEFGEGGNRLTLVVEYPEDRTLPV